MSNLIRILMYIDKKVIITMSPDWSVFPIVPQHARQLQVYVPRGICQGGADDHDYHDNCDFDFVSKPGNTLKMSRDFVFDIGVGKINVNRG